MHTLVPFPLCSDSRLSSPSCERLLELQSRRAMSVTVAEHWAAAGLIDTSFRIGAVCLPDCGGSRWIIIAATP